MGPLRTIEAIRVYGSDSVATVVAPAVYFADTASLPSRIGLVGPVPAPGRALNGIEIDITVGVGVNASAVPEPLRQAVRLTLAALYENRGDVADPADNPGLMPLAAQALVTPWRIGRL
jgi:uncharacterized phiE125 gp8 family phage protein